MKKILFIIISFYILVTAQQVSSQTVFIAHSDITEDGIRTLEGVLQPDNEKKISISGASEKGENELYILTDDTLILLYFDGPFGAYDFFYSFSGQTSHNIHMPSMSERNLIRPDIVYEGTMYIVASGIFPYEEWNVVGGSILIEYNVLLERVTITMNEKKFPITGKKGSDI